MTITLVDTSALIAALLAAHPRHTWARNQIKQTQKLAISTHTLAEAFKVLTVHPGHQLSAEAAMHTLQTATANMQKVPLDHHDYFAVMERCTRQGLSGSVIFDALIAQAALKAGAEQLLTLNPKDFKRLGEDVEEILVCP